MRFHVLRFLVALVVAAAGASAAPLPWPPALDTTVNTIHKTNDGRTIERFVHGPRETWGYPEPAPDSPEWSMPPDQETGVAQQNHNSFYVVSPTSPSSSSSPSTTKPPANAGEPAPTKNEEPSTKNPPAPLCVVLHSANRTAYDYLGFGTLGRQIENHEDPATVMTNSPPEFYSLYLNSTNSEWWGWSQARQDHAKGINTATPAEKRVLDTIEWVCAHYPIDRNRIYLCGVSMGGCGTLGLGIVHGDIFAAIRADVPAGTGYAAHRWGGFSKAPAIDAPKNERDAWIGRVSRGVPSEMPNAVESSDGGGQRSAVSQSSSPSLSAPQSSDLSPTLPPHSHAREIERVSHHPDPPYIVDFSSQQDNWAMTQPAFVQAAQAGRLPLVLSWGPFGHVTFASLIAKYPLCEVALAFPWLEIRKNAAYPVFTHATCDQQSPWLNAPADYDNSGQMNAWFRWAPQLDSPDSFMMRLWIAHPGSPESHLPPLVPGTADSEVKTLPPANQIPEMAKADITLRRLQTFTVNPGKTYEYQVLSGHSMSSGTVTPDTSNLITIPQVTLTTHPSVLTLKEITQ